MEIAQTRFILKAKDFDRTCDFYGETLGFPRLRNWDREGGCGAWFQAGQAVIEVLGRSRGELGDLRDEVFDYQGPSHKITLGFNVESAQKAYEDLLFRQKNIPGGLRTDADGTLIFETHDPDGVRIRFSEAGG